MVSRDLNTHFKPGRTEQSTLRRTFAALLRDKLGLVGIPRNQAKPERPANFALSPERDDALQTWIERHVELVTWVKPEACLDLGEVEVSVIERLKPLLNLQDNEGRSAVVSEARKRMADDVRAWIATRPAR